MSRRSEICDRIIEHLYFRAQRASCRSEHELWSITLRLVGIAKSGQNPTLDQAAIMALGISFEKWRKRVKERDEQMAYQLSLLIPDYDASMEQAGKVRRPEKGSGDMHEVLKQEKPMFKELVQ